MVWFYCLYNQKWFYSSKNIFLISKLGLKVYRTVEPLTMILFQNCVLQFKVAYTIYIPRKTFLLVLIIGKQNAHF